MKRKSFISVILTLCLTATIIFSGCAKSANSSDSGSAAESNLQPRQSSALTEEAVTAQANTDSETVWTIADIKELKNTENFAKNTLEHIFDGTVNGKGKATGYHYAQVIDSKGEIIAGSQSKKDANGVYTAKVKVSGVKKEGFSSFYPDDWTPQQVVDAINEAYSDAIADSANPHGSLWIGYSGDLEIDMYLNNSQKITTAFPVKK